MAGHSKWHNIRRKKEVQDAKRGKIFMQHARNIYTAAKKEADPELNPTLRTMIDKARADNMPRENIERAIQKASGTLEGANYEEMIYEGYGPGGVAVIVEALTDNKNRTAAEVRHAFRKYGGNLGETNSVSFLFNRQGYILIVDEEGKIDEDELTMDALEAGAEDVNVEDGAFEIFTAVKDFHKVLTNIHEMGYDTEEASITYMPTVEQEVTAEQEAEMEALLELLEDDEDTQEVHHNMVNS